MSKVTHECTDAQAQGCRRPTVAGLQGHLHVLGDEAGVRVGVGVRVRVRVRVRQAHLHVLGDEARVDVDGAKLILDDADLLAVVL